MADDSFSEVTSQSWFSRIGDSIKGIIIGLIIFVLGFPVLFWNEGRSVERFKTLEEGGGEVITVPADKVDPANNGKLVHLTAMANTQATLTDGPFGVSVNAIKLKRKVKMYQWQEKSESKTEKKLGGGTETVTTYRYEKVWHDKAINSGEFRRPEGHQNPGMRYQAKESTAQDVTVGAFRLPAALINEINNYTALDVSQSNLPTELGSPVHRNGGGFYIGQSPTTSTIGDMQVTFEAARPAVVSLMASQVRDTFEPFQTKAGGTIALLRMGTFSAANLIKRAQTENTVMTWVLRVVGFMMMFIGLGMLLKPLSVVADVLPLLGDLIGAGTGLVAFLLAAIFALVTIAIAWFFYRPILSVILIGGAVAGFMGLRHLKKKKAKAANAS